MPGFFVFADQRIRTNLCLTMEVPREELLRQKALLEEHLAWIEQKLREDAPEASETTDASPVKELGAGK